MNMYSRFPSLATTRRYLRHGLAACSLTMFVGGVALADDTEVFFPAADGAVTETIRPNILFIMDTSGSMASTDGTSKTRLDRVKEAMNQILDEISQNTNVGLMRLSDDEGGPVLFPVSYVEADADEIEASCSAVGVDTSTQSFSVSAKGLSDTALELTSTTGATSVNPATLILGTTDGGGSGGGSGVGGTEITVTGSNARRDDAHQLPNGRDFEEREDYLEFGSHVVGIRFTGVGVPQGENIIAAYLTVTDRSGGSGNNTVQVFVQAEADNNSDRFRDRNGQRVLDRPLTAAVSDPWEIPRSNNRTSYQSPDLAKVIQEVISRPGWSEGNDLSLIISPTSGGQPDRDILNRDAGSDAPKLTIIYGTPVGGGIDEKTRTTVGLRFDDVFVPRGVKVTSAYVDFKPAALGSDTTSLLIRGEASDDSAEFIEGTRTLSSRIKTTATQSWAPDNWDGVVIPGNPAGAGDLETSADITDIVNEVISRSGWCGGNALSLFFTPEVGNAGSRVAHSAALDTELAPTLYLNYSASDPALKTGCTQNISVSQISDKNDDAEERISGGDVLLNSSDLELGKDGSADQIVAMRFTNVQIPKGGTVLEADITFTSRDTSINTSNLVFTVENNTSPGPFSSSRNHISNRASNVVAGSESWTPPNFDSADEAYTSPDLSALLQQVVSQSSWAPGNSIVVFVRGSGTRRSWSADGSIARAPVLRVRSKGILKGKTVRARLKELVNDFNSTGFTPLAEVLTEAAYYYRGDNAYFGRTRGSGVSLTSEGGDGTISGQNDLASARLMRISHCASYTGGKQENPSGCGDNLDSSNCEQQYISGNPIYKSPIYDACQSNNIVLLSDGEPNNNNNRQLVRALAGGNCSGNNCGIDLARFMATGDQSSTVDGVQTINTYTIGFADLSAADFLQKVAAAGNGTFSPASQAEDLAARFREIIAEILDKNTTFVAPAVTINSFNRLTHLDQLYFALFRPEVDPNWRGNLKRFRLLGNPGRIVDQKGVLAVSDDTGFFNDEAYSFWTNTSGGPDGGNVTLGGALDQLPNPAVRKLYTNVSGSNLTDAGNILSTANAAITNAKLGLAPTASPLTRQAALDWARGFDVNDENADGNRLDARDAIGDPLHSEPVLVTYGGDENNPDITVFFGTNEGFIHAIDGPTGKEVFGFIPDELLPNLSPLQRNVGTWATRPYGMDGPLVALKAGTKVLIIAGMRRGGRSYYALDVSNRSAPKVAWKITGGATSGFGELGQTWSRPIATKVLFGGSVENVLIFGGGYDTNQDTQGTEQRYDASGRALFMVRQSDGKLLWSAGHPSSGANLQVAEMVASIPGDPAVVDLDNDGYSDRIYIADTNANVFRFDINPESTGAADFATGGLFAALGEDGDPAENRRIYNAPDVALVFPDGAEPVLAISLGTGYRAHPLDKTVGDRFHVLFDKDVTPTEEGFNAADFDPIDDPAVELFDATSNRIGSSDASVANTAREELLKSRGAYINLRDGEKVLTTSRTIDNSVIFATFQPGETRAASACAAGEGVSRLYVLDVIGLAPAADLNNSGGVLTTGDRDKELAIGGIPPNPVILFPDNPDGPIEPVVFVGPEAYQPNMQIRAEKTTWQEMDPWLQQGGGQ